MTTLSERALRVCALALLAAGAAPGAAATDDRATIEEVVVTGSRITRANLSQPTPVTTLSADDLRVSGTTDLGRLLAELPALGATGTLQGNTNSFSDLAGLNLPDLRRLGTARTLTLVNGKRHVGGSPGTTAVDLGTIPTTLVERVEVITGGASAVYGSDAVSGVINIIMRDDFEGVEVDLSTGESWDGGYARNYNAAFTLGSNFAEERGNFTFTLMRDRIGDVQANDLDHADDFATVVNPASTGENDGIPDLLLRRNVLSERIDENSVLFPFGGPPTSFGSADGIIAFDRAGNPVPQAERELSNSFAFGSFPGGCDTCFEIEDYVTVIPEVERTTFQGTTRYAFTDWASFYSDVKYVRSDITEELQPSFDFGTYAIDVADNPFLDDALRAELLGLGIETVTGARFHADAGSRRNEIERELVRVVGGFEGDFDTGVGTISYDAFYNYGETDNTVVGLNRQVPQNWLAAVDAVEVDGEIVCRDPGAAAFPGCVPFNPFGRQNSPEAVAFSFVETTENQTLVQKNAGLTLVSDTGPVFNLPGGPIGWAAGIEWRREQTSTDGDALVQADLTESAAQPDQRGGYEVFEGFFELSLPLLSGRFLARELTLDAAYRTADYTHSGSADAWKVGAIWAPFDQLSFRATFSEAVRAPNIEEAFLPTTPTFFDIDDPCDDDQVDDDPDRAANCAALGIPAGFDANDNVSVDGDIGGNADLTAEDSESYTVGLIYQPDWADGLSITVDYYDIEIIDAIIDVEAQDILDNCVDASGGPDSTFCGLIMRDPISNDIMFISSTFVNASRLETQGVDVELAYGKRLSDWTEGTALGWLSGALQVTFTGNYLRKLDEFVFQNRPDEIDIERGEIGDPIRQFRASVSYDHGDWTVGWEGRYIGDAKRYARGDDICEDRDPCTTGTTMYHDFNVRYRLPFEAARLELYGGINNVTDEAPPRGLLGTELDEAIYDPIGRYYFLGLRAAM
ncbi:MAG: TonB-dependent receptor [Gammaproteobacteria bacterium]|nr:TonB-dependent receptor [Gammaproteobacteria bacterium]